MDERRSLGDINKSDLPEKKEGKPEERREVVQPKAEEPRHEEKAEPVHHEHKTAEPSHSHKPEIKKQRRKLHLFSKLKRAHPGALKAKINHYIFEYKRVLSLARKPTKSEYKELAIMVAVGTTIIGVIGFLIQMAIQFI